MHNDLYAVTKHIFTFLIIKHFYLDVLKATCVILTYEGNDDSQAVLTVLFYTVIVLHCNYSHRFLLSLFSFEFYVGLLMEYRQVYSSFKGLSLSRSQER